MSTAIADALADLLPLNLLDTLVERALKEDLGAGDLTTENSVPANRRARARLVSKATGVLAGLPVFLRVFTHCDPDCRARELKQDGDRLVPGELIAEVEGSARALLIAERTALNFLQRMSGIATATAELVALVEGRVRILDTRKTTPGLRPLEKYAVRCGGGENHRFGLFDQVMIKENHIDMAQMDVESLTRKLRQAVGNSIKMTVEARNPEEARAAVRGGADVVLLDNMTSAELSALTPELRSLAASCERAVELEASGGIDKSNLESISRCGLDRVSIGALTHSARALDLSLYLEPIS